MVLNEKNFIFTIKINLMDNEFIVLREPTAGEFQKTQAFNNTDDSSKLFEQMRKLLPNCIVDSSFENENGEKASGQEVFNFIDKSSTLELKVITEWINALPFSTKK